MNQAPREKPKREMGLFAGLVMLVGLGLLGVTGLGAINTLFDLKLSLGVSGSSTSLPAYWDEVTGLGFVSLVFMGLSYFGSSVAHRFAEAKGKPLLRLAIVMGAMLLLAGAGRGLQLVVLRVSYGSMLAYYCTDVGSIEDVKKELADNPTLQALDGCMYRTAQWDRVDLLPLLIEAGANFEDKSSERPLCVFHDDVSQAYIDKAIALGASPNNCPNSRALIYQKVRRAKAGDDAKLAKVVRSLMRGGWSAHSKPKYETQTVIHVAEQQKFSKTLVVLNGESAAGTP